MKLTLIDFLNETIYQSADSTNIVKQGGNAVKGVARIKREYIIPTVNHFIEDYLAPLFQVTCFTENKVSDKVFLFGSTGKKADSGDIDIALDLTKFDKKQTKQGLMQAVYTFAKKESFAMEIVINTFNNQMIHFAYPQYNEHGTPTGQTVQIDLFFCQYPAFAKFIAFYPGENKTKYKSAHRNELLKSIAKVVSQKNIFVDKNTYEVLRWQQEDIDDNGVYLQVKTLIDDNGVKLKYKETDEDLLPSYAKVIKQTEITHSPIQCIKRYIGNYKQKDIQTFEQLFKIIISDKKFKFAKYKNEILQYAAVRFQELTLLEFPSELKPFLNK